jgi:type I restriction enzyme S subunit
MNKFSKHDKLYIPQKIHEQMKRTWVKKLDVLLNITGASIGRTAIYLGQSDKANVNQHVCIIRLKNHNELNPTYLNFYLSSDRIQGYIQKVNAGGTREALNYTQIKDFDIPLPPIELQNKFASIVKEVEAMKEQQKHSKNQIDNIFNALMQKAFKGELKC